MIRVVLYIFLAIILISVLRSIIGIIGKVIASAVEPAADPKPPAGKTGGDLKRDPVCGVFVAESASVKKSIGGETLYFCSAACRDRYSKA